MKHFFAGLLVLWFICTFPTQAFAQRLVAHGDTTEYLVTTNGVDSLVYRRVNFHDTRSDSIELWSAEGTNPSLIGAFAVNGATRVWRERIFWRTYLCVGYATNMVEEFHRGHKTKIYEGSWIRTFRVRIHGSKMKWRDPRTNQFTTFELTEPASVAPYIYPR